MQVDRRLMLQLGALAGASALAGCTSRIATQAKEQAMNDTPLQNLRTPGKPGDFDFLSGEWRIRHRRMRPGQPWDEFEGEATCWSILEGVAHIEELRIPARDFSGMGLRVLDVTTHIWSDFWVNSKSGVVTTPGMTGSFENGVAIFLADEMDGDKPIKVSSIWDEIAPRSCRWRQGVSRDGGRTWEDNWIMHWTHA